MTPPARYAYAAATIEREHRPRPWDHPYDGTPGDEMVCIHCGFIGSYAHTQDFYDRWQPWEPD